MGIASRFTIFRLDADWHRVRAEKSSRFDRFHRIKISKIPYLHFEMLYKQFFFKRLIKLDQFSKLQLSKLSPKRWRMLWKEARTKGCRLCNLHVGNKARFSFRKLGYKGQFIYNSERERERERERGREEGWRKGVGGGNARVYLAGRDEVRQKGAGISSVSARHPRQNWDGGKRCACVRVCTRRGPKICR